MITVYLDSQDFSHFSTKHKDHAKYAQLKNQLLQLKKEDKVRFVFSDVHIYEVFPKNGQANINGLDRIHTVAEFCGKDSLPSFSALLEHEVTVALCKKRGDLPPTLSYNWFPAIGIRDQPLDRTERVNRAERRALLRNKNQQAVMTEFCQKYPFLKDTSVVLKYLVHQAEWEDVVRMVENGIQDIESFSSFLISRPDNGLDLSNILRRGYNSYVNAVNAIRREVELRVRSSLTDKQKSMLAVEINQMLDSSVRDLRVSIVPKLMADLKGYDPIQDVVSVNDSMLCFDTLIRYLAELIRRSSQFSTPRQPLGSDFADALHVTFFPIVDVFRTDAAASDVLGHLYPNRKADIIKDVFQLPTRIMASL